MGLLIKVQPGLEQQYDFDTLLQFVTVVVGVIAISLPVLQKAGLKWRQWRRNVRRSSNQSESDDVEMSRVICAVLEVNASHRDRAALFGVHDAGGDEGCLGDYQIMSDDDESRMSDGS
jgi:hypothetical protein